MDIDSPDLKKIIDSNLLTGRRRTNDAKCGVAWHSFAAAQGLHFYGVS